MSSKDYAKVFGNKAEGELPDLLTKALKKYSERL